MLRRLHRCRLAPLVCLAIALFVSASHTACSATQIDESETVDPQQHGAFLWNGFRHRWTYNHRLNRMGDYLTGLDCEEIEANELPRSHCRSTLVHTGASGTGADTLSFTSQFAEIVAPEASFQTVRIKMRFDGREEREIRIDRHITISPGENLERRADYTVLLNGFDVYTEGARAKAKKVKRFRVWVGDDVVESDAGELTFDAGAVMDMNCDSFECKQQSNRVRYTMEVRFLVIGHDGTVTVTPKQFETNYSWSRKTELNESDVPINGRTNVIQGAKSGFESAVAGFREIDFDLSRKGRYKDHWYVGWTNAIRKFEYDASEGRAEFDLRLMFKEWNARSKKKLTSLARKGEATLRANLALLQFERARIQPRVTDGELTWPGKNRSPIDGAAEWRKRLTVEF